MYAEIRCALFRLKVRLFRLKRGGLCEMYTEVTCMLECKTCFDQDTLCLRGKRQTCRWLVSEANELPASLIVNDMAEEEQKHLW